MSNTITIKDPNGNIVCSVESVVPTQHSDLFAIVEEAQKTIESYRLECAKYANALQVMSTESFGENVKTIATKFLQKVKQFFQKVALWCKNTYGKNIISRIKTVNVKSTLNDINDNLYLIAKECCSIIDRKDLNLSDVRKDSFNRLINLTSKTMTCLQRAALLCIELEKSSEYIDSLTLLATKSHDISSDLSYIRCCCSAPLFVVQHKEDEDALEKEFNNTEDKIDEFNNFVSSKLKEINEKVKNE